jgi:SET domain-containing protein
MRFIALREIQPGEELMFDYGIPLWFEPAVEQTPQELTTAATDEHAPQVPAR